MAIAVQKSWFGVVDPELADASPVGHYQIYDRTVCEAAERLGYQSLILGRKGSNVATLAGTRVIPAFTHGIWQGTSWLFFRELRSALAPFCLKSDSVVFFQSVFFRQILGLALFGIWSRLTQGPRLAILLRYQPEFYRGRGAKLGFRLLEFLVSVGCVRFFTDSRRLAEDYRSLTKAPFGVVPIPHPRIEPPLQTAERGTRLRLGTLGGARGEKGINEIIDAIGLLNRESQATHIEFILHVHTAFPDASEKIAALKAHTPDNVKLIEAPLDDASYAKLLYSLDVLILPYWHSVYRSRTSGPLAEAIAAGKVVIVTKDTWLDEEMQQHGAGIACADRSPEDLARAILEAAERFAELNSLAQARKPETSEHQQAEQLLTQIVNSFPTENEPVTSAKK